MSAKGPKGGPKLTKAQIAQQKKEEEERLLREEEERLWQEKITQKLKTLKQDRRAIERAHREELSESQINGHFTEKLISDLNTKWAERCAEISDGSTWRQYMSCDPCPSFSVNRDIADFTSWMSLERERIQTMLRKSDLSQNQIKCCMSELTALLDVCASYLPHNSNPELEQIYNDMQEQVNDLLDFSTLEVLKDSSGFKDDDSGNVQLEEHDGFHDVYVWGNLANNPRLKTIDFGKEGEPASHVQMSLLKGMHNRNVALRVVRKNYQTSVTTAARSSEAPSNTTVTSEAAQIYELTPVQSDAEEEAEEESPEPEEEGDTDRAPSARPSALAAEPAAGEAQPDGAKDGEETDAAPAEPTNEQETPEEQPEGRASAMSVASLGLPDDHFDMEDYAITGGVWEFEIFEIPNQPKRSGKWIVRQVYDERDGLLNVSSDVLSRAKDITASQMVLGSQAALAEQEAPANEEKPEANETVPAANTLAVQESTRAIEDVEIDYKIFIPCDQVILAPPEVGWFDEFFGCWRESGIKNVKFNEDTRELTFTTNRLGKFAALQDRKLDLPYQNWQLRRVVNELEIPVAIPSDRSVSKKGSHYEIEQRIGVEFELLANYTEIKLNVDSASNEISIVQQIHEEVSGTSIVADPEADPEALASAVSLREDKPFKLDENTGESAVKDLKDSFMGKSVFLFPSLTQPCSIKKNIALEDSIYMQMAILTALGVCQFCWTPTTATQVRPQEQESEDDLSPSQKPSSDSMEPETVESPADGQGADGEEDQRPKSPEVSIPVADDEHFKPLRDFELVLKYAKSDSCPYASESAVSLQQTVSSTSELSDMSSVIKQVDWRLMFVRYPNGPCYRLAMEDSDDLEAPATFSREIAPGAAYHSDMFHAVLADLGISVSEVHQNAQSLNLIYVKTIADLLQETRVLSNSV